MSVAERRKGRKKGAKIKRNFQDLIKGAQERGKSSSSSVKDCRGEKDGGKPGKEGEL